MGRKSLNKTYEQILAEGRIRSAKYYEKNKEEHKRKVMARYNKKKYETI